MKLTLLSAAEFRRALPMPEAVELMKEAYAEYSAGAVLAPQRLALDIPTDGITLVKPAYLESGGLGAKIVSVFPGNRELGRPVTSGLMVILDPATGEPLGLADGGFVTAWRTGAASGAATDLLARPDARVGAIFGCGAQARTQALALDAVRSFDEIRVYARTAADVARFVEDMSADVRARLVPASTPLEAVEGADVICAATTASRPVFDGTSLADGAHVNGIGSFTLEMQEVDEETVGRARVFVDSHRSATAEAGDLMIAARKGRTDPTSWVELGEVVAGREPGRQSAGELTFFKSVGLAVQDVKACAVAMARARELGWGRQVEI
ncbi:MAG: ornithine cyclodeaminase family protein [Thermoanaerobaculia bacterium]|nr:ornithine cyclodeaminase family protein [Thermoanaerobaculia bacterium]